MTWLYETAKVRAEKFKIEGVTYKLTQGVVKNIIPAIASTNAIIAGTFANNIVVGVVNTSLSAACCNEAFKIATNSSGYLSNYMMYNGVNGVYTYTFEFEQKELCAICGSNTYTYEATSKDKLQSVLDSLAVDPQLYLIILPFQSLSLNLHCQLRRPSLRSGGRNLYMQGILEATTRPNLEKTLEDLGINDNDEISVTDPVLPGDVAVRLLVKYV